MKKFLKSRRGVTILEGLIALALLALVATGTFAVLLSTSRKSSQPDLREEMALAIERASQKLQVYVYPENFSLEDMEELDISVGKGLCGGETSLDVLREGWHDISCLLPPICDANNSHFRYQVVELKNEDLPRSTNVLHVSDRIYEKDADGNLLHTNDIGGAVAREITFDIECDGFTL